MKLFPISPARRLVLLPPSRLEAAPGFGNFEPNSVRYTRLLAGMQRLRGRVYLADGAIEPADLTFDGRHRQAVDMESWHVLSVDSRDRVHGCARYVPYSSPVSFHDLGVAKSEIAASESWKTKLRAAVETQMCEARERGMNFVEVGGWALSEEVRLSAEALRIALSMYSLAEVMGGSIGLTTATVRHSSATILRKIGGSSLEHGGEAIPRYYDSRYRCEMEILRFDSAAPNSRYRDWVESIKCDISVIEIVTAGDRFPVASPAVLGADPVSVFQPVPLYS